jgi:hypothetical protein
MLRVGVDLIYLFFQPTLKLFEILKLSWLGDLQCNPANYFLGKALELFSVYSSVQLDRTIVCIH